MYKDIFQRITRASKNNSLTFFVGAGISKLSNAPKWSELIDAFCSELKIKKETPYSNDDYLSIPQMFYYSINQNNSAYYTFIEKCFGTSELTTNAIHKRLFDFSPHAFVTTNFDNLLEKAAVENCQAFKAVACDTEISQINGDKFILKLHGDLEHKNIVLKEEDYLNYSENFKLTETLLKSIFATNTVVFIGYGLNDYNIKLILNWTKTLLKDNFVKPIFIYTDDTVLSKDELKYHESKGLHVVDFKKLTSEDPNGISYAKRYELVLEAISKTTDLSLENASKYQAFEILYNLLKPLDSLQALRIQDIKEILEYKVIIEDRGTINASVGDNVLLKYYIEILEMNDDEKKALSIDILDKYNVISSVFLKARIHYVFEQNHKYIEITGKEFPFADPKCIQFDYGSMQEYTKKEYDTTFENYKKAYYLAKLNKHFEAYNLFVDVAITAYKEKNYILHYMAQANRKYLYFAMKSINNHLIYHSMYDLDSVNGGRLNDEQAKHLFENLPLEIQKEYICFEDLSSINSLYEISYDSFIDGNKLQNAIESNTLEMGQTSGEKVISRINSYLHFFLSNSLFMDEFVEFKYTIRNLMSLLVYKYSAQQKKSYDKDWFEGLSSNKIFFDEIDFYCFITYFEDKEIIKLFTKHGLKTITFNNMDVITNSVLNIFNYYNKLINTSAQAIEVLACQRKIKSFLSLINYMEISQELVDAICKFIFKYEFREIDIGDKIKFLDSQIWKRNKTSEISSAIIEDKLIYYFDEHLKSIKTGSSFDLYSSSSNLNYWNLVHYIDPKNHGFTSRRLSIRVSKVIANSYSQFKRAIEEHYFDYISKYQQNKFTAWLKAELNRNFHYKDFRFLVSNNIKLEKNSLSRLKAYFKKIYEKQEQNNDNGVICRTISSHEPYEELQDIGYYCFIGHLPKKQFKCFLGYSAKFDFFYEYKKFDFDKFDVSWLLQWRNHVLDEISKDKTVKEKIRQSISKELDNADINDSERKNLTTVLVKHFC